MQRITVSTHLVRLDHRHILESIFLRGEVGKVRAFADRLLAERGVRFGSINLVGVDPGDSHDGEHDHIHAGHSHLHPPLGWSTTPTVPLCLQEGRL